jgi:uncharacterized membrane protein
LRGELYVLFFGLLFGLFVLLWALPLPATRRMSGRARARVAMGLAMGGAGLTHFANPTPFLQMMPAWVPFPLEMVHLTGALEVAGGVGLLVPRLRRPAAICLALYLVAVFPANVNVAVNRIHVDGYPSAPWYAWVRLPFQALFIWWVLWCAGTDRILRHSPRWRGKATHLGRAARGRTSSPMPMTTRARCGTSRPPSKAPASWSAAPGSRARSARSGTAAYVVADRDG